MPDILLYRPRVIPVLQLSGQDMVKTLGFKDPMYLGDPLNAVRIFNDSEADELVLIDINATRESRAPDLDFLEALASMAQMPLAYGGGITSSEQASAIVRLGFEKVAVQSLFWEKPDIAREISTTLGSQALIVSIDCRNDSSGWISERLNSANVSERTPLDEAIQRALLCGAGELLVTSIESEGTMRGPELGLMEEARSLSKIPLIYNGGVASDDDFISLAHFGVDAIGVGAKFLFRDSSHALMIDYPTQQQLQSIFGTQI